MNFFQKIVSAFTETHPAILIVEFLALLVLFYFMMRVLKSNNAELLNILFAIFVVITGVIFIFIENINNFIYVLFPLVYVLAMIVMFSTEIKRTIWNLSNKKNIDVRHLDVASDRANTKECINEIIKALQNMSKNDIGALIILGSAPIPNSILESGVHMDCVISAALIESVFFPKTPLHDGAMIIKGNKILSAGCFLPLSQEVNIPKDLGTRHRAGIGITETIDVTAIIVSEETGVISIATGGKLKRYADSEMLRQTLKTFYEQENND
ncbi:MAG: diadenylate cyclase CdaA [Clostridia bacterium]|nr:diadenylate cyclase CdaA [Clostridia bacterium]